MREQNIPIASDLAVYISKDLITRRIIHISGLILISIKFDSSCKNGFLLAGIVYGRGIKY